MAAYCRVSTKQEEQLNSYETQVRYYTDRINREPGWKLAGIYADKGITGTSMKKRDEFNKLIRQCKRGKVDILDGRKNHPLTYDDAVIRQILQCVIVESKEKIKVVFIGGMEVEAEVEQ